MSANVDNRIVEMKFDNATFEKNAATSLSTLERLKKGMDLSAAVNTAQRSLGALTGILGALGVDNRLSQNLGRANVAVSALSGAMQGVPKGDPFAQATAGTTRLEGGVTAVSKSFIALSTIAITALSNITNRAINAGTSLTKSFTVDPMSDALAEYELKLSTIKTVMNGTGESLEQVSKSIKLLDEYSDSTIYSLQDMVANIKHFTNAGVDSERAAQAIKGVAQVAALSGASAQEAAGAMLQLGKSLGQGFVGLMDWNSVETAGMATMQFKDQLIETAEAMGTLKKAGDGAWKTTKGSIVDSTKFSYTLKDQWLTTEVLTETLNRYSDANSDIGKKAYSAAQDVSKFSQVMSIARESVATTWGDSFQIVIGNLKQATNLWSGVSAYIGEFIQKSADARNEMLQAWKDLGGRKSLIQGVKQLWDGILSVISPIRDAFRDIFPATTAQQLFDLTERFKNFTAGLKIGEETAENLRSTFRGVFAIFDILKQIVGGVFSVFGQLFGVVGDGAGGFLSVTAAVGDFLVRVNEAIEQGRVLGDVFDFIGDVLSVPLILLGQLGNAIGSLFGGSEIDGAASAFQRLGENFNPLVAMGERFGAIWGVISDVLDSVGKALEPLGNAIGNALRGIGDSIAEAFASGDFSGVFDAINTGLLAGLILLIRNFFKTGFKVDLTGGLAQSISDSFGALTDAVGTLQANIKGDVLLKIAAAIAILTGSLFILSGIDPKRLTSALAGATTGLAAMQVSLNVLTSTITAWGALKLGFITKSLLLLGGAVLVLSFALKNIAELSWEDLSKGLLGVGALLAMLAIASRPLSKNAGGMREAGLSLLILSAALKVMASALVDFAGMSWEEMGRGLVGVAGALTVLAGAMKIMPRGMLMQAIAITVLGGAMKIMASAVSDFAAMDWMTLGRGMTGFAGAIVSLAVGMQMMPKGMLLQAAALVVLGQAMQTMADVISTFGGMDWNTMGRGFAGFAGSLLVLAAAMKVMPKGMLLQAVALVVVGQALETIGGVVAKMGGMSWEEIGKGMATLAGALGILAIGLKLMSGTLMGSAAMVVAAGALAVMAPILLAFSAMSWESIGKGLTMLAGAFVILAGAGYLLAPVVLPLMGLGASLVLMGTGFALAGAGALAFATAFGMVVAAGTAGLAVLGAILQIVINAIPVAMTAFAEGIVGMAQVISDNASTFAEMFGNLLNGMLDEVIAAMPKIRRLMDEFVKTAINVIENNIPDLVIAGLTMINKILEGIDRNIEDIVDKATDIIVKFLGGISKNLPRIIDAGIKLIISFVNGLADGIRNNEQQMRDAGWNLASAMVEGMANGIRDMAKRVIDAAISLADSLPKWVKKTLGIHSPSRVFKEIGEFVTAGFAEGLTGSAHEIEKAFDVMNAKFAKAIKKTTKTAEKNRLCEANKKLIKDLTDDKNKLVSLSTQLAKTQADLAYWEGVLQDRTTKLNSNRDSWVNSFGSLPDISKGTNLDKYIADINAQTAKNREFEVKINQLRAAGADEATIEKLMNEGVEALPFVNQLLAIGPTSIEALDSAIAGLKASAKSLGTGTAEALYRAGVNAAQGMVNGLKSQEATLTATMEKIASAMVKALKKKLKIKSPSREMMEIGRFTDEGLAKGLVAYSGTVEKSASKLGDSALETIKASMGNLGSAISGNVDLDPTIRPVLDLTKLQQDATRISGLLATKPIVAEVSYSRASSIAADEQARRVTQGDSDGTNGGLTVLLEQNNYSPEALDTLEVYRQSKSLMAQTKQALEALVD